jgi:predicted nucleic acid-binding protein
MKVLLDTTVLSEPLRKRPNAAFMARLEKIPADNLFTSAVCVMELRYGCALKGDEALWERIKRSVLNQMRVLPFGQEEAARCGEILSHLVSTQDFLAPSPLEGEGWGGGFRRKCGHPPSLPSPARGEGEKCAETDPEQLQSGFKF